MRSQIAVARKSEKARARRKDFEKKRNIHKYAPIVKMVNGKRVRKALCLRAGDGTLPKSRKVHAPKTTTNFTLNMGSPKYIKAFRELLVAATEKLDVELSNFK